MADYLVKGWWKDCSFLLTPHELQEVLRPYHLVNYAAHVPADYTETPLEEYMTSYQRFYEKLTDGEHLKKYADYGVGIHVVADLSGCKYGKPHIYEGKQYLLADFDEPPVGLAPFALYPCKDGKGRLCFRTGYSYMVNSDKIMGLQLEYPKMIQYRQNSGYEALRSTREHAGYQVYENLKKAVTKQTKSLYVMNGGEKIKTNVRVSAEAKKQLPGVLLFKSNEFVIV